METATTGIAVPRWRRKDVLRGEVPTGVAFSQAWSSPSGAGCSTRRGPCDMVLLSVSWPYFRRPPRKVRTEHSAQRLMQRPPTMQRPPLQRPPMHRPPLIHRETLQEKTTRRLSRSRTPPPFGLLTAVPQCSGRHHGALPVCLRPGPFRRLCHRKRRSACHRIGGAAAGDPGLPPFHIAAPPTGTLPGAPPPLPCPLLHILFSSWPWEGRR